MQGYTLGISAQSKKCIYIYCRQSPAGLPDWTVCVCVCVCVWVWSEVNQHSSVWLSNLQALIDQYGQAETFLFMQRENPFYSNYFMFFLFQASLWQTDLTFCPTEWNPSLKYIWDGAFCKRVNIFKNVQLLFASPFLQTYLLKWSL